MRIGLLYHADVWNVAYRAQGPAEALRQRGHEIRVVERADDGTFDPRPLQSCDVVHVYRRADEAVRRCVDDLQRRGIAVTFDNDDDVRLAPEEGRRHLKLSQRQIDRMHQDQVKLMARADLVTTTSEYLVDAFQRAGAERVVRIGNHLFESQYRKWPRSHEGKVIGWVAGAEHGADDRALGISKTLNEMLERHDDVRVVTVGLALQVGPARYKRHRRIPLATLAEQIRKFDIAIAPLGDIPMSYARSDIKLKEYAAAGVPWLASARGPYTGLGAKQGGMLVEDGDWLPAIEALLGSRLKRYRLGRNGAAWAKTQSIAHHADQWLAAFEQAIEVARERRDRQAVPPGRATRAAR